MSHVGKRPRERRGLRREEEEEGWAVPRKAASPGGGPLGFQLAWSLPALGAWRKSGSLTQVQERGIAG